MPAKSEHNDYAVKESTIQFQHLQHSSESPHPFLKFETAKNNQ